MSKPVYVLGTGLSHDGSSCLLKDGQIRFAIEKERITRKKHDGGNDSAAIAYLLQAEGIGFSDLSLVVQNANFGMFAGGNDWLEGARPLTGEVPVVTISHHLAHAYSALGTSPFDEGAVLVIDGCGSAFDDCIDLAGLMEQPPRGSEHLWYEKDSYYTANGGALTPVAKDFSPWGSSIKGYVMHPPTTLHSIGGVYAAVSKYVFRGLEDPGKLMGLAPYGRAGAHDFPVFDLKHGRAFVRYDWMDQFRSPARDHEAFKAGFQHYADIARHIQREVERAILYVAADRHARAPARNLCYAGGVALNAVANRRLLTEGPFENVYVQPAAADNGLAIGCAYYGWLHHLKQEKPRQDGRVYCGRTYADDEVRDVLARYGALVEHARSTDVVEETADALAAGKTVGWFQDGAEFGPRALGNRSILADPRSETVRDFINAQVKFREDFRPFAPTVLGEDRTLYFEGDYASPHMLLTAPVREEWRDRIPAVVHRDHSARIQTLTRDCNPRYYDLIAAFKRRTGLGLLLNTSLNRRGMPIVETPDEAMMLYIFGGLDILVLGDHIVTKPADFQTRLAAFNRMVAQASARKTYENALAG